MTRWTLGALPPAVDSLVRAARPLARPPEELRQRVRARLAATLGSPSGPPPSAPAIVIPLRSVPQRRPRGSFTGHIAWRIAASVAIGSLVGFGIGWRAGRQAGQERPPALKTAPVRSSAVAPPLVASTAISSPGAPTAASMTASRPRLRVSPAQRRRPDDGLAREQSLLERARALLADGHPEDALAPLEEHRAEFPHGQLVEEREALWIEALAAQGNVAEARARATAFRARFPESVFLPLVISLSEQLQGTRAVMDRPASGQ